MLKTILFTHDDMDGAGCRIVFSLAHQELCHDDWRVLNCTNSFIDNDVMEFVENDHDHNEDTVICFGDICCSCSVMEILKEKFKHIMVWDHHPTNFPITEVLPEAVIMPKNALGQMESGTSLMYKFFAENAVNNPKDPKAHWFTYGSQNLFSELVDTIRSYDTYEWKDTNNIKAKRLQSLFWLLNMDRFCEKYITAIMGSNPDMNGLGLFSKTDNDFIDAKLENEEKAIERFTMDKVYPVYVRGYTCAFAVSTLGANISELGYRFLREHTEFDLFIQYSLQTNTFQIRTAREDLDTGAEIAAPIGGGGHPKASGATLDIDEKEKIIDILINYLNK